MQLLLQLKFLVMPFTEMSVVDTIMKKTTILIQMHLLQLLTQWQIILLRINLVCKNLVQRKIHHCNFDAI